MKIEHYERTQEQNEELGISEEMIAEEKERKEKEKAETCVEKNEK